MVKNLAVLQLTPLISAAVTRKIFTFNFFLRPPVKICQFVKGYIFLAFLRLTVNPIKILYFTPVGLRYLLSSHIFLTLIQKIIHWRRDAFEAVEFINTNTPLITKLNLRGQRENIFD